MKIEFASAYMMKIQMHFSVSVQDAGQRNRPTVAAHRPTTHSSYGRPRPIFVLVLSTMKPAKISVTPSSSLLASRRIPTVAAGTPSVLVQKMVR